MSLPVSLLYLILGSIRLDAQLVVEFGFFDHCCASYQLRCALMRTEIESEGLVCVTGAVESCRV